MLSDGVVTLRRYQDEDREQLIRIADNPRVSQYLDYRFPSPYTPEDADMWLDLVEKENVPCNFAVIWEGQLVGGAGLEPMQRILSGTAEVGYWFGEPFWGRGLATRAAILLAEYGLNELLFIRLQAIVFGENTASMRVLEKAGFVKEGIMRRHIRKNGHITDAHLFAKTRT
jgi:Acetyltransferases, including N-acetylases of ribosomal proteins